MALLTLAQTKTILQISDDPDILLSATTTDTSATLSAITSTAGIKAGDTVTGAGIQAGTVVSSVPSGDTTLVLSKPSTASGTGVAILISLRGSSYDALITLYIPIVEAFINRYCNETFGVLVDNVDSNPWPTSLQIPASQMIWSNIANIKSQGTLQSHSLGDFSETFVGGGVAGTYSQNILSTLNMYRKVWFV